MDDLEFNPLHRAFLGKFRRIFDIACEMSYLIAIPQSETLIESQQKVDQNFALAHILMPSKLLKSHFNPLQASHDLDDIELDGNKLICNWRKKNTSSKETKTPTRQELQSLESRSIVRILGAEIGYNAHNKEYKIILIDRPLVRQAQMVAASVESEQDVDSIGGGDSEEFMRETDNKLGTPMLRLTEIFARGAKRRDDHQPAGSELELARRPHWQGSGGRKVNVSAKKSLRNQDDCFNFLDSISAQLTYELETHMKGLQSSCITSDNVFHLDDVASQLRQVADDYVEKFDKLLESQLAVGEKKHSMSWQQYAHRYRKKSRLAVENYLVHLMHGKLMVAVQESCKRDDELLDQRLKKLSRERLTIGQLGAQECFSAFQASGQLIDLICQLPSLQSPLAMVNELLTIVHLISESLAQSVQFRPLVCAMDDLSKVCDRLNGGQTHQVLVPNSLQQQYNRQTAPICSDDLIAALIFVMAQARPQHYCSVVKYLELFGWTASSQDQEAYFTATLQIVVQYIIQSPDLVRNQPPKAGGPEG